MTVAERRAKAYRRARMRTALTAVAVIAVGALPASAAAAPPTATAISVTERPGLVRAAIAFTGERILLGEIVASDPDPFGDGEVRLPLRHTGVRTTAPPVTAEGVTVAIAQQAEPHHDPPGGSRRAASSTSTTARRATRSG